MQSESLCKRPAKGQHGIEFFFCFFFSNIFQNTSWHCKYFWPLRNTMGKDESPLLHAPISHSPSHIYTDTTTQCLPICTEKHRSGLFIDWPFKSQHMLFCLYSTVFSEMDYFLILAQGLLLCSGVTRTWCKWEAKVGRNVNSSVPVQMIPCTCPHCVCFCEHFDLFLQQKNVKIMCINKLNSAL